MRQWLCRRTTEEVIWIIIAVTACVCAFVFTCGFTYAIATGVIKQEHRE